MMPSLTTARAQAFVAEHRHAAVILGDRLAGQVADPERFERTLTRGFRGLADPVYAAAQPTIVPGSAPLLGVRWPLVSTVARKVDRALADQSPAIAVYLAERLAQAELLEVRLFSHVALRRGLAGDPERSWQVIRRLARRAADWVSVDSLADLTARGILLEAYRWAELEQLVYSPHRWERRLVGSTLAELPFRVGTDERANRLRPTPALALIATMIGEADPDVRKALSWALRSWRTVDPAGVADLLRREAMVSVDTMDGNRAWVVRDALTGAGADEALAGELRPVLAAARLRTDRRHDTSRAHEVAHAFGAA
jgi:3-methyladenine DNA glycosylase AlkD